MAAETDLLSHITECKCGLDKCARRGCVCVCNEPELLMATLQPQKANNLEIIKQSLRQKLDTHSVEFLVQLFINSSECLRTHSEEEDGGAGRCI